MKKLKYSLLCMGLVFGFGFSHEYQEKYVCHMELVRLTEDWCYIVVIKAETMKEAEEKFQKYIDHKIKRDGGTEDKRVHVVAKLKDAIMIEHE